MGSVWGVLRTLERVTRPMGHDRDVATAGPTFAMDDVVSQLCQITYFVEDIRNLLAAMGGEEVVPAGASVSPGAPPAGQPTSVVIPEPQLTELISEWRKRSGQSFGFAADELSELIKQK